MDAEKAIEVVADQVTRAAVQEMIDNGLWDMYIEEELTDRQSDALKNCLVARVAKGPDPATLSAAIRALR